MQSKQIKYLTNLRVFATLLVIILHTCANYMDNYHVSRWQWESVNLLNGATRMCIGLFLMITGALLVSKNIDLKKFLKTRFSRILFPFLFWSLVYLFLEYCDSSRPLITIIQQSFYFGAYYHFWYIYVLIGIYLFIPILSVFLVHADKKNIQYFLIIWSIWLINNMHIFKDFLPNIDLVYFSGYLGYVVLGYYLHNIYKKPNATKYWVALLLGYAITVLGTSVATQNYNHLETIFYQYLDANIVIMAAATFLIFKYFINQTTRFITFLSRRSYGVFFIHPLFLYFLNAYNLIFSELWILDIIVKTVLVSILSWGSIYFLNKLPKGKMFIG